MGNGQLALLASISCWPKSPSVSHQVARDVQWMCLTLVERMLGYSIYMSTCIEYLESVACPLEDHFTTFEWWSTSYHINYVILFYNTFHWRIKILWVRLSYSNSYLAFQPCWSTLYRPDSKRHWAATPLLLLPLVSLISRSERLVASQTLMLVNFLKKILCHTMFSFVLFCG